MSFDFIRNGVVYHVHSEVGEGPARIVVDEERRPDTDMEPQEDSCAA